MGAVVERVKCKTCKQVIAWALTEKHKPIPIDPEPVPDGNLVLERRDGKLYARQSTPLLDGALPRFKSHFATCKDADQHRRSR